MWKFYILIYCFALWLLFIPRVLLSTYSTYIYILCLGPDRAQSRSFNRGEIFASAGMPRTISLTRKKGRSFPRASRKSRGIRKRCLCPATSLSAPRKYSESPGDEKLVPSLDARYCSLCGWPIKVWIIYTLSPRAVRERIFEVFPARGFNRAKSTLWHRIDAFT